MSKRTTKPSAAIPAGYSDVCDSIVQILNAARQAAARNVNALMTATYWEIGRRIVEAEQKGKRRAGYGEQLIERLSLDLTQQFGRGFSRPNLQQMRQFYLVWSPDKIRQTVSSESAKRETVSSELLPAFSPQAQGMSLQALAHVFVLSWSAYVRLLAVKDDQARQFYEAEALRGGWSVRQIDRQIGSQFYERTAQEDETVQNSLASITRPNQNTQILVSNSPVRFCTSHPCVSLPKGKQAREKNNSASLFTIWHEFSPEKISSY